MLKFDPLIVFFIISAIAIFVLVRVYEKLKKEDLEVNKKINYIIALVLSANIPMIYIIFFLSDYKDLIIRLLIVMALVNISLFSGLGTGTLGISKSMTRERKKLYNALSIIIALLGLVVLVTLRLNNMEVFSQYRGLIITVFGLPLVLARWQARRSIN